MQEQFCPHLPLECQRIRLRDFRADDLDAFAAYRADPDIARYQGWDDYSRADAREFLAFQLPLRFAVTGSWYQVAIAGREDDRLLGDCAIHFTTDESQVEIGFTLAQESQGNGYAYEAVSALINIVFSNLGKQRIIAIAHAHNAAAGRLLNRLGFDHCEYNSANPDPELLHTLDRAAWEARGNNP